MREKNLATKAGKLHLHLQKWECLHNMINEPAWKIVYILVEFLTINGCLWQPKDILAGIRRGNSWCLSAGCNVCYCLQMGICIPFIERGSFWVFFFSLSLSLSYYFFLCIPVGGLIPIILYSLFRLEVWAETVNHVVMCVCTCVCAVRVRVCVEVGGGGGRVVGVGVQG